MNEGIEKLLEVICSMVTEAELKESIEQGKKEAEIEIAELKEQEHE